MKNNLKKRLIPYYRSPLIKTIKKALSNPNKKPIKTEEIGAGMGHIQAELGILCLQKYPSIMKIRNENANFFEKISQNPTWPTESTVQPAWLRQKVFAKSSHSMDLILDSMHKRGIRIDYLNWPEPLISDSSRIDLATEAARNWIDIPIHQNINKDILKEISDNLKRG